MIVLEPKEDYDDNGGSPEYDPFFELPAAGEFVNRFLSPPAADQCLDADEVTAAMNDLETYDVPVKDEAPWDALGAEDEGQLADGAPAAWDGLENDVHGADEVHAAWGDMDSSEAVPPVDEGHAAWGDMDSSDAVPPVDEGHGAGDGVDTDVSWSPREEEHAGDVHVMEEMVDVVLETGDEVREDDVDDDDGAAPLPPPAAPPSDVDPDEIPEHLAALPVPPAVPADRKLMVPPPAPADSILALFVIACFLHFRVGKGWGALNLCNDQLIQYKETISQNIRCMSPRRPYAEGCMATGFMAKMGS